MQLITPSVDQIIRTNQYVCNANGNIFQVLDQGKISSALHTAFYPGSHPFIQGGVAKIAGALCYYLVMAHAFQDGNKRVGSITAITFMKINGWKLTYPLQEANGNTALANAILECAAGRKTKEDLIEWFENHKSEITQ